MLIDQVKAAEADRQHRMMKAQAAFDGQYDAQLKTEPGKPDDNTDPNYAAVIVQNGVDFLFGKGVDVEIGGDEDTEGPAEKYLNTIWPEEERTCDLIDLATNGAIHGHAWLKIVLTNDVPSVMVMDSMNLSAEWDSDNYKQPLRYFNQYNTVVNGKPKIRRERVERQGAGWVIYYEESQPDSNVWTQFAPPVIWNYPFAPFFHCKNLPAPNEFYGKPDLTTNVLRLIHRLHRLDGLIDKIIRAHASPKPVARGMRPQELKTGTEDTLFLPDKEQELTLLEMTGDLTNALERRRMLRETLAEISHVPEIATGKTDNIGKLSGLALQILYSPLLKQTDKKRLTYGLLIVQVVKALLVIGRQKDDAVTLNWSNPLPRDTQSEVDGALSKKQLGISEDSLMRELGYDPEVEREKRKLDSQTMGQQILSAFNEGA